MSAPRKLGLFGVVLAAALAAGAAVGAAVGPIDVGDDRPPVHQSEHGPSGGHGGGEP